MKKLMMMAVMFVASATAFAGDSDALKAILKAKTYADAETLINSSLSSLANDAEKAKAYNKLVDLAYEVFNEQNSIVTENQVNKQMGREEKPVDQALMAEMAFNALTAAKLCDEFDQKPNEKGKVSPKFAKKNAERLWTGLRNTLVNAGQEALTAKDNAKALKYWSMFVESNEFPMFAECNRDQQKDFFGQVAHYSAQIAFQEKDMAKALQLADIAMKIPEEKEFAVNLKLEVLGNELKTRDDSVKYCNQLKDIYANDKNDGVMEKLYNVLLGLGQDEEAIKMLDDALAVNPDNFVAIADKGLYNLNVKKDFSEAAKYLHKAFDLKSDNPIVACYAGSAYTICAQNTEDKAKQKELYKTAITILDKAKELDPDHIQSNWGYVRWSAYYNYYGEDAPETKQAEADYK
jgi:tetratricopeptide (TPR) repeat protein